MNKTLFAILVGILLSVSIIFGVGQLSITNISLPSSTDPGNPISGSITVNNVLNSSAISQVNLVSSNLVGPTTISAPSIPNIFNLAYNTPQQTSFSIAVPSNAPPGTYTGTINATENGNLSNIDTKSYNFFVNAKKVMTLPSSTILITGHRSESASNGITITNNGNVPLNSIALTPNITLSDSNNNTITLTLSQNLIPSIAIGTSANVTLTASIPDSQGFGRYKGNLNVIESNPLVNGTIPLEIDNFPKICDSGIKGNFFNVKITDPSSGSDFYPGGSIGITANVVNKDSSSRNVIVGAKLYDIKDGNIIKSSKSKVVNIDASSNKDIALNMTVPYKFSNHPFVLFAKAYEDGNEDNECNEANMDVNLKRKDDDVIVNDLSFNPNSVNCGDSIDAVVSLWDIGRSDENAKVNLRNSELGLNIVSNPISLDSYGGSSDRGTLNLNFVVPTSASTKTYSIDAITTFNNGNDKNTQNFNLYVICANPTASITMSVQQSSFDANAGTSISIPVTLTNNLASAQNYNLEFIAAGGWANTISQRITLNGLQSGTFYLYPNIDASTPSGMHSGTINVKSGSNTIASRSVSINVAGNAVTGAVTFSPTSYLDKLFSGNNLSTSFWIIGDIALLIIAIYFIRLLMRRQ